jgi:hypothetical protein
MEVIKDTIASVMHGLKVKRAAPDQDDPQAALKKILTKKEFRHIKISRIWRDILYVHVDSSAMLYQLGLQKQNLVSKLNKDKKIIQDIRFCLGDIK